eukprot:CAMPEP_0196579834 /NCGR_PEP_ID=MMETSP1081-20130531/25080_1 /TAXON_ID=36882 /ORGANISM="Pyramimonas amylifera, Strain CCMP720" /LENGTH=222 /DNA_ID=CAMNT_0041899533 /DNA_START=335 /DNA_END=1000 /DNA_ORIENTATION=+
MKALNLQKSASETLSKVGGSARGVKRKTGGSEVKDVRRSSRARTSEVSYTEEKVLGEPDVQEAAGYRRGRQNQQNALLAGRSLKNNGAGPPPSGAPAPFGGTKYLPLTTGLDDQPLPGSAPSEGKRNKAGQLTFPKEPAFLPNLTPSEMLRRGVFGGCYFNPKGGKAGIFGRVVEVTHEEFPANWFQGLASKEYRNRKYDIKLNKYAVKAGQDQAFWESKGW